MSCTGPDMITSSPMLATKPLVILTTTSFGIKRKWLCKKQYHGAFGGTTTTKFEGRIEVLKASVYNFIGLWQSELYIWTTREVANYVGKTLKYYCSDAKTAIENLELPVIRGL